ncbi:hypothetical protein LHP98_02375 [Rhodobacter sp. Har01]|uniref:hypothetical protein n=1 Tax=Rhodobacter sp. Har01 TaxID=2883999 RepID=UPI001D05EC15|nr:hypothetical protein [Rhodobacter sp. Har01]MCB6176975.1 hypothetical protein [Rhodobacter sp. Har01]
MGSLGEEQDGLSGLDGLDKVNTGIEKWGGAIAGGIDYNLKDYPNAPKVGTFLGRRSYKRYGWSYGRT